MKVHQISVFMENRAGQLAEIAELLAANHVDLRAISIAETADYGVLRMIVEDAEKATGILREHGYIFSMTPVTVIAVPDQPGGLSVVLSVLAKAQIDIEYMYSLFTHRNGQAYMVFRIAEEEKFTAKLAELGMHAVGTEELGLK